MAKFCGKCGSRLDKKSGLCPSCDKQRLNALYRIELKRRIPKRMVAIILSGSLLATIVIGGFGYLEKRFGSKVKNAEDAIAMAKTLGQEYGYENAMSELTKGNETYVDGDCYYRLQQNYRGIPVYGRTVICAVDKQDTVTSITGNALDVDEALDLTPQVTAGQVKEAICTYLADEYGVDGAESIEIGNVNDENLCIYNLSNTGESRLAYCVYAGGYAFVVDAHTPGTVLLADCYLRAEDVVGNLQGQLTQYQNMHYTRNGENFFLFDPLRNIETNYAIHEKKWKWVDTPLLFYYAQVNVLKDSKLVQWKQGEKPDASAVDAYHNVKIAYDYFDQVLKNKGADGFGKVGIDLLTGIEWFSREENEKIIDKPLSNQGALSLTIPDTDGNLTTILFFEAAKDNKVSCATYLDAVAHEYMHSVEKLHSAMVYSGESGAIMEALSDIFGELVESWDSAKAPDWTHRQIRNLKDPGSTNCPWVYQGKYWEPTVDKGSKNDNGGVHKNSTVISHAAYLMWNGGIDADENKKISNDDLAKIWYRAMLMMPSDCNFLECRKLVELAASSLNLNSSQIQCIQESFDAVGIQNATDILVDYHLKPGCKFLVIGKNGKPYDNYTITVSGKYLVGLNKKNTPGLVYHIKDYRKTTEVTTTEPFIMPSAEGVYTVEIADNSDKSQVVTFLVGIRPKNTKDSLTIFTNFTKESVEINTDPIYATITSTTVREEDHLSAHCTLQWEGGVNNRKIYEKKYEIGKNEEQVISVSAVEINDSILLDISVANVEDGFRRQIYSFKTMSLGTRSKVRCIIHRDYVIVVEQKEETQQFNDGYYYVSYDFITNPPKIDNHYNWNYTEHIRVYELQSQSCALEIERSIVSGYEAVTFSDEPSVDGSIRQENGSWSIYSTSTIAETNADVIFTTEQEFCKEVNRLLKPYTGSSIKLEELSWDSRWDHLEVDESGIPNDMVKVDAVCSYGVPVSENTVKSDIMIKINEME